MEKNNQITEFLRFFAQIAKENPQYAITQNAVYHKLTRLGVSDDQKEENIEHLFQEWITRFGYKPNIDVFVSPSWTYFCQFKSKDHLENAEDHIKMYIPLDKDHIENGANMIFDFLSQNNIPHLSKIGKHIRFDNIVIRLVNPDDAQRLLYFVQSNSFIQQGLIHPNPFAFNSNNIALACDRNISYNSTIAQYIKMYIEERRKQNKLDDVCAEDFFTYVENYYQQAFSSRANIEQFIKDFELGSLDIHPAVIANYANVTKLFLKVHRENIDFKGYIEHFKQCTDRNQLIAQQAELDRVMSVPTATLTDEQRKNVHDTVLYILQIMSAKYGREYTIANMEEYIRTGQPTLLTRTDNLRDKIISNSFREHIQQFLQESNMSFHNYIQVILTEQASIQKTEELQSTTVTASKEETIALLREAIKLLTERFDHRIAIANIERYLQNGDASCITRKEGLRDRIAQSTFRVELISILEERNITLRDFINELESGKELEDPIIHLNNAIMANFVTYEQRYREGVSQYGGREAARLALAKLFATGSFMGFTRENNGRNELVSHLTREQIIDIIRNALKLPRNGELNESEMSYMAEQYSEMVISTYGQKQY